MTTVAAVAADVQHWLDSKGITPSKYGTVRLVKAVNNMLGSPSSAARNPLTYTPGTTVVAPDYRPHHECGHGLHFAATARDAKASAGGSRTVVCDVDLETLVVIDSQKVKAKFCHVRFEGDETDFGTFA